MVEFDYDLFISHASEDKPGFVRALVAALEERGLRVWFDEAELVIGKSLTESIEDGLRRSRFGVVILSRAFFSRHWPRKELNAFANRASSSDEEVILPIWLDVSEAEVREYSPLLVDLVALKKTEGVGSIAQKVEARVRGGNSDTPLPGDRSRLDPLLLQGRTFPYQFSPIINSNEHALVSRIALAGRMANGRDPLLRPENHAAFLAAISTSSHELLLNDLTSPPPVSEAEVRWQRVVPTNGWAATVRRPTAQMIVGGWTAEGRAALLVKHHPGTVAPGWITLLLDIAIRPEATPSLAEAHPLSLDEAFNLILVPISSLLDEIAPAASAEIGAFDPVSIACLFEALGDRLGRYVPFRRYGEKVVEGADDASAVDWCPGSMTEIATREARVIAVRGQIEQLFIDGGYDNYQSAVQRLESPHFLAKRYG